MLYINLNNSLICLDLNDKEKSFKIDCDSKELQDFLSSGFESCIHSSSVNHPQEYGFDSDFDVHKWIEEKLKGGKLKLLSKITLNLMPGTIEWLKRQDNPNGVVQAALIEYRKKTI